MAKVDSKGRELYSGETYDEKTGKYRYTYDDSVTKKRNSVYSYTLIASDRVPPGKNVPTIYGQIKRYFLSA